MRHYLIITTDKNIISIIADLIITTNFNNNYYYSLWQKDDKYLLYINNTNIIDNLLAELILKLTQITCIKTTTYTKPKKSVINTYDLIFKNYD